MALLRFPATDRPRASIIILAWKQRDRLLACLRSLVETASPGVPFEVIVVSNDAPPAIVDAVRTQTDGVRLIEADRNLGFSAGCNLGASVARGDHLVLLNDDAIVAPHWLAWLITTVDAHPSAGAVGSLVLFPDGRIQEAGSVIWRDGSTMPVGRELPAASTDWHFVRTVDYASACSLLIRRSAWDAVGGFDASYGPAYYEDVDLCLGLQARGYDVLFEPRSKVWHEESASSDEESKRVLFARNQKRLQHKWAETLTRHELAGPDWSASLARAVWRARGMPRRILIIDNRVPEPALGSGFGRVFDAAQELSAGGYDVSIFPTAGLDGPIPDALVSAGVAIVTEHIEAHLSRPWVHYDAVMMSRPNNFGQFAPMVRQHQPAAVCVYDCEALFWRRTLRQAAFATSDAERTALTDTAAYLRQLDERNVAHADFTITVSREEAELLAQVPGCSPIRMLLPTERSIAMGDQAFEEREGIAFVAGWLGGSDSPNADGLRWFVADVLPLLHAAVPDVHVYVTGANPPEDIRALAGAQVRLLGHVDDLAALYGRIRVVICPIRFGAGVKVKTVQALQYGVPVVATSCGAEGIETFGLECIAVADTAQAFAAAVTGVLTEAPRWRTQRSAIASLVEHWHREGTGGSWCEFIDAALVDHALARERAVDGLRAQLQSRNQDIAALNERIHDLSSDIEALTAHLDSATKERHDLQQQVDAWRAYSNSAGFRLVNSVSVHLRGIPFVYRPARAMVRALARLRGVR